MWKNKELNSILEYNQENCPNPKCISSFSSYDNDGKYDIDSLNVQTPPEFNSIVEDTRNITQRQWIHATTNPNWMQDVQSNNVDVHVGTIEAALDRVSSLQSDGIPIDMKNQDSKLYFYVVEFDPKTTVVDEQIHVDDDSSLLANNNSVREDGYWGQAYDSKRSSSQPNAAVYSNRWEAPGSLSVECSANTLKYVNHTSITLGQMRRYPSIYNYFRDIEQLLKSNPLQKYSLS